MFMNTQNKSKFRDAVSADKITFHANGEVTCKRAYFYRHGQDAHSFADRVKAQAEAAGFVVEDMAVDDQWKPWPKTSYFSCTFRVEQKPEA